eukprot:GILI01041047.1.p1 GENE.GILI01041047.1~~GILI01041047.1.p1  ORF type:complete len:230 (-),score=33.75 GILI01041047.1:173-862(-)
MTSFTSFISSPKFLVPVASISAAFAAGYALASAFNRKRSTFKVDPLSKVFETQVFLGGACDKTTWRKDIAIPLLEGANISFYNPQVEQWSPELLPLETKAKNEAEILLFVVDGTTRAVASLVEAAFNIGNGREIVIVLQDLTRGSRVSGIMLNEDERKDLNRGRAYLKDLCLSNNVQLFSSIKDAMVHIVDVLSARNKQRERRGLVRQSALGKSSAEQVGQKLLEVPKE